MNPFKGLSDFIAGLTIRRRGLVALAVFSLLVILVLSGCASLKEAGWVSGATLGVGAATSLVSGNPLPAVAAGALAGGVTAAVINDTSGAPAPAGVTSGWGALAVLFKTSGKWGGICALTFILLGWLVPGPLKLHLARREKAG